MESKIIVFLEHKTTNWNDLEISFQKHNFIVLHVNNFQEVISVIENEKPNGIIIDWKHGRSVVQSIARQVNMFSRKSVLVVCAQGLSYNDQIVLLEQGVDECFDESLSGDLIAAKISALMRRVSFVKEEPRTLMAKDVLINLDTQEVIKGDRKIDLTFTQFKILYLLASKRDYVFTRDEILTKVWGENSYVTDRTVDVHVKRLREKLGEKNKSSDYIQTIHGLGYRFA